MVADGGVEDRRRVHLERTLGDAGQARVEGPLGESGDESLLLGSDGEPVRLPGGGKYENIMDAARQLVDEDPKRVAQLVKTWVAEGAS